MGEGGGNDRLLLGILDVHRQEMRGRHAKLRVCALHLLQELLGCSIGNQLVEGTHEAQNLNDDHAVQLILHVKRLGVIVITCKSR